MKSENLDDIDRRILAGLQRDSRQPIAELAKSAGLSPSACHRRIKLLEERQVIASYGVTLDRAALGYSIELFVELSLLNQTEEALTRFEQAVLRRAGDTRMPPDERRGRLSPPHRRPRRAGL